MEKFENYNFSERHLLETSDALYALRQQRQYIDLMIVCNGEKIPAHRFILASASPFFEKVLLEDSRKNDLSVMEVENVSTKIMEYIITFVYLGDLKIEENHMSPDDLLDVMTAAHHVQLDELVELCGRQLLQNDPDFTLELLWMWAEKNDSQMMRNIITEFIAGDCEMLPKRKIFLELPFTAAMATIEKMPRITNSHQEAILNAAVAWVKNNPVSRQHCLHDLTARIQLDMLSHAFVNEQMNLLPALRLVPKFFGFVPVESAESLIGNEAVTSIRNKVRVKNEEGEGDRARSSMSFIPSYTRNLSRSHSKSPQKQVCKLAETQLIVIGNNAQNQLVVTTCPIHKGRIWTQHQPLGISMIDSAAYALHDDNLLIIGGESAQEGKLNTVQIYNLTWKTLSNGPNLRIARSAIGITVQDETAYLYGGIYKMGHSMLYAEMLNLPLFKYDTLPSLHYRRSSSTGTIINNRLYVLGGASVQCEALYLQRPETGWADIANLPDLLSHSSLHAVNHDSMIYAFRNERISHLYYYNPIRNAWKVSKVTGHLPETIVSLFVREPEIWAIDKNGLVFTFDLRSYVWEVANGIDPTISLVPLFFTILEKD